MREDVLHRPKGQLCTYTFDSLENEMYRQILFGEEHWNQDFIAPVLRTLDRKDIVRWDTDDDSDGSVFMEQIREDYIQVELLAMRVQDDKGVQSFTVTMQDREE